MTSFLLFYGPGLYPQPGVSHKIGEFATVLEAEQTAEQSPRVDEGNWAQVVDSQTLLVMRAGRQSGVDSGYWWTWRDGADQRAMQGSRQ